MDSFVFNERRMINYEQTSPIPAGPKREDLVDEA